MLGKLFWDSVQIEHQSHPQKRLIEEFSDKTLSSLKPALKEILSVQTMMDEYHDASAPNLLTKGPYQKEQTSLGELTIGKMIYSGKFSAIFEESRDKTILIKYQADMDRTHGPLHALVIDAWFMNEAYTLGVAPAVYFLSPPSRIPQYPTRKCSFKMDRREWDVEYKYKTAVRYMIMERSGRNLDEFKDSFQNSILPLPIVVKIGINLMNILSVLHLHGIAHGDIHPGNIVLTLKEGYLQFIDFGRAFRIVPTMNDPVYTRGTESHYMYSPWTLDGFRVGMRDDLFGAIQTMASIMYPSSKYWEYGSLLESNGFDDLREWKWYKDIFSIPTCTHPVDMMMHLPVETKAAVKIHLCNILTIVRGMNDVNAFPPYEEIKRELDIIHALIV